MEHERYMDEEALNLFLIWGQTDEDRAEIAAALKGEPAKVYEPTRCERLMDVSIAVSMAVAPLAPVLLFPVGQDSPWSPEDPMGDAVRAIAEHFALKAAA